MHKILLFIFNTIAALSKQASLNGRVLTRGSDISQFPLLGESWLDFTSGDTLEIWMTEGKEKSLFSY